MTNTRRDFLSQSAVTALGLSAIPSLVSALEVQPRNKAEVLVAWRSSQ